MEKKKSIYIYNNWYELSLLATETCEILQFSLSLSRSMESNETLMVVLRRKLKQASLLWLEGFKEACCLHRVFIYCFRHLSLSLSQKQLLCVYAYSQFHLVLISIVYAFLISKLKVETAYDPNGAVFSLKRLYFLRKVCMQLRIL